MRNDRWFCWLSQLVPSSRQNQDSEMTDSSHLSLLSSRPYITYTYFVYFLRRGQIWGTSMSTPQDRRFRWAKHNFHSEVQMKRKAWRVIVLATSKSSKAGIDFITRTTPRSKPWHLRSGMQCFFMLFPCLSIFLLGITWWLFYIILHVWQIWLSVSAIRCNQLSVASLSPAAIMFFYRWEKPVPNYVPHRKKRTYSLKQCHQWWTDHQIIIMNWNLWKIMNWLSSDYHHES